MELKHKKIWVMGLMLDCTFGQILGKCPAGRLRMLPVDERLEIVNLMPESELDYFIEAHKSCVETKFGAKPDFYG